MTSTLREGRIQLHMRLNEAAYEGLTETPSEADPHGTVYWTRQELCELLAQARDAVIRCPHQTCAYCFQVERQVEGYLVQIDGRQHVVHPSDVTILVRSPKGATMADLDDGPTSGLVSMGVPPPVPADQIPCDVHDDPPSDYDG